MDASRFVRGLSVPPSVGAHPPPHVSKAAAPAQVSVGPLNQRKLNHPYMFLRPLSHLIWPGNRKNTHNNTNNSTHRKETKFQEGHVASLEASPSTEEDEEERKLSWVLKGLGVGREPDLLEEEHAEESEESTSEQREREQESWVMKILRVRSIWEEEGAYRTDDIESDDGSEDVEEDHDFGCPVIDEEEEGGENVVCDRDSFGRFLKKVSLDEAKVYAKMSYLSNLAYCIERIKTQNLLKHQLRFVTSSLETKKPNPASKTAQNQPSKSKPPKPQINPSAAYTSAASAASYLQSEPQGTSPVDPSVVATTNSMTAVVSAKEETKEEIAKDLNLGQSSCCEWYVCDDEQNDTSYFVIQGSESIASWQANLLFEPVQFEGLDVLVHRGIYEAAKGIYSQMLPFIKSARSSKLRFTGHSLGGSLSLLINLMLLIRGEVSASSLLPVVTFGAPAVMCGGDYLLDKLGLGKDHVCGITMHRDIVPRAFSCNYPDHVARILKAVNGNFRRHPCLTNQKLLYAPMGKLVILQPDERASPPHDLLPPGCGLYFFNGSGSDNPAGVRSALSAFLNSPHPLEILSDRGAYGPFGTVLRDHDMNSYLKSLRCVIRQELKLFRKDKKHQKPHVWWPLVVPSGADPCIIMSSTSRSDGHTRFDFSGMFRGGEETLRRFKRLVASRHVHLLVLVLFPARLLILGPLSLVKLI